MDADEVRAALRTLVEIAARFDAQDGAPPEEALAELVAGEEEILAKVVALVNAIDDKVPVVRIGASAITRADLRAAAFAGELAELVRAARETGPSAADVRRLMEIHDAEMSSAAFEAMLGDLSPDRVNENRGPAEASLIAVAKALGKEGEPRSRSTLAQARTALKSPEVAEALKARVSGESLADYLRRLPERRT